MAHAELGYVQYWEYSKRKDLLKELLPKMGQALFRAEALDPNGFEPLEAWVQLSLTFARYHTLEADAARRAGEALKTDTKLTADQRTRRRKELEDKEKGELSFASEYLNKAVVKLRKAVQLDPTDALRHYRLAEMLDRVGDRKECRHAAGAACGSTISQSLRARS